VREGCRREAPADQGGADVTDDGFDFGKFGHAGK
jgi:hypothetical protein